jgi:predicted nucleic acid-binding protein
MIILDNSVLSAFTRLKLLSQLRELISSAIISKDVLEEYSEHWQKKVPDWIKIIEANKNIELEMPPVSLSSADLSLIRLGLEHKLPIASDDKPLRQFAKKLEISITGSLGLLKALYQAKLIKTKGEYLAFLNSLKKDIYISDELMNWALEE